jgi:hypothetical protein
MNKTGRIFALSVISLTPLVFPIVRTDTHHSEGSDFEGSPDASQFSSLKQIDKANVHNQNRVWFHPAGDHGLLFGSLGLRRIDEFWTDLLYAAASCARAPALRPPARGSLAPDGGYMATPMAALK